MQKYFYITELIVLLKNKVTALKSATFTLYFYSITY